MAFHIMEQFDVVLFDHLIQYSIVLGSMYFLVTTCVQMLFVLISLQLDLAASSFAKVKMFFSPHPPRDFGLANSSHFAQGKV